MKAESPLPRFILLTLAWLPVTFIVWYFAAPLLLYPALALTQAVLHLGFGDLVRDVAGAGANAQVLTTLKPGQAVAGGQVIVDVNMLLYSFGMPMFAALVLAAREPRWPRILAIGLLADAARGDRVRVPVRLADPADRRAGGDLGADAPRLPRAAARHRRSRDRTLAAVSPPRWIGAGEPCDQDRDVEHAR